MRSRCGLLIALLAAMPTLACGEEGQPKGAVQATPKPTKASVVAEKQKLERASATRAVAEQPPPGGLGAVQLKTFKLEMAKLLRAADRCDAETTEVDQKVKENLSDIEAAREREEEIQLWMQGVLARAAAAMDRLSRATQHIAQTLRNITRTVG